jgi:hypothetical protein
LLHIDERRVQASGHISKILRLLLLLVLLLLLCA